MEFPLYVLRFFYGIFIAMHIFYGIFIALYVFYGIFIVLHIFYGIFIAMHAFDRIFIVLYGFQRRWALNRRKRRNSTWWENRWWTLSSTAPLELFSCPRLSLSLHKFSRRQCSFLVTIDIFAQFLIYITARPKERDLSPLVVLCLYGKMFALFAFFSCSLSSVVFFAYGFTSNYSNVIAMQCIADDFFVQWRKQLPNNITSTVNWQDNGSHRGSHRISIVHSNL